MHAFDARTRTAQHGPYAALSDNYGIRVAVCTANLRSGVSHSPLESVLRLGEVEQGLAQLAASATAAATFIAHLVQPSPVSPVITRMAPGCVVQFHPHIAFSGDWGFRLCQRPPALELGTYGCMLMSDISLGHGPDVAS